MNNFFGNPDLTENPYAHELDQYVNTWSEPTLKSINVVNAWDDLNIAPFTTSLGPSIRPPSINQFKTNGAGSTGTYLYGFDEKTEQEIFFTCQLPHSYKEGTDIKPHTHFCLPTTPADPVAELVEWGLEYNWQNANDTFGNTTVINAAINGPNAFVHTLCPLGTISGTGKKISSILTCRLFRKAGGYVGNALLLSFDFHIQNSTLGSREEYVK